jgi:aspartyl protease family protein
LSFLSYHEPHHIIESQPMFLRNLLLLAVAAAALSQIPSFLGLTEQQHAKAPVPSGVAKAAAIAVIPAKLPAASGTAALAADASGHYRGSFRINGKPVEGMVDTGATSVAINESTARRLGFSGNALDFRYEVSTANGKTRAAFVMLDRVELDDIRVRDVQAAVLKDDALSSTLIGMSFLKKLSSFSVQDGALRMKQ